MRNLKLTVGLAVLLAVLCVLLSGITEIVELPPSLQVIETEAFYGSLFADEVLLPDGVKNIESRAFSEIGTVRVYLPDSLEEIAPDAFSGSDITGYGLPETYAALYCMEQGIPYEPYESPLEEFTFTYPNAVEATLTKWSGNSEYAVIPESPDGKHTVTKIANGVFKGKTALEHVLIPDTVTSIGASCFENCSGLKFIRIPEGVTVINSDAFRNCTGLKDVSFSEGLVTIGNGAFRNCTALLEADLPDSVEQLGTGTAPGVFAEDTALNFFHYPKNLIKAVSASTSGTFMGCVNLKEVTVQEGVETLAEGIFHNAMNLTSVNLPSTLLKIGNNAFSGATGLTDIDIPDFVHTIGAYTFENCTGFTLITLPENLETIGQDAFKGCISLVDVNFNQNLITVGNGAFRNCTALLEADLPDSVEQLGTGTAPGVFEGDTALNYFHYPKKLIKVVNSSTSGALFGCVSLKEVTVQEGVEILAQEIFQNASSLTAVHLPSTLEVIGQNAFSGCKGLPDITLPDAIFEISHSAFENCTGFTQITLPESLETIGQYGFRGCTNLEDVVFNPNLKVLYNGAFQNCTALLEADLPDSVEQLGTTTAPGVFDGDTSLYFFHYPKNLQSVVNSTTSGALANCTAFVSVAIPEGTVNLAANLFHNAASLKEVALPSTLKTISQNAFSGCKGLPDIVFPDGVTEISYSAFENCTGFTRITLPKSLETIGQYGFRGCANLEDVIFNQNLKVLHNGAFQNCTALLEADLPDSVEQLGTTTAPGVFDGAAALNSFHYPKNLQKIVNSTTSGPFAHCTALTDAAIPEGVETLPDGFFRFADGLTDVTLPSTLRTVGTEAFRGATALREIDLPDGIVKLGERSFYDCSALRRIYIPQSVTAIGKNSFANTHHNFEIWTEYGAYAVTYAQNNNHAYYYLSLTGYHLPNGTLYLHYDFNLYGYIRSTIAVDTVHAEITDSTGKTVMSADMEPGVTDYSLTGTVAALVDVAKLPLGSYTFTLSASTAKSSEVFVKNSFRIVEPPLMVQMSGYNLISGVFEEGESFTISGLVTANYPITRIAIRVVPDNGSTTEKAASPNTASYQLISLGFNLNTLSAGNYTVSVVVQGHNETKVIGGTSVIIGAASLPSGKSVDSTAFAEFIGDKNNRYYFINNYSGIADFAIAVTNNLSFGDGMKLFFSSYDDYLNAEIRDLIYSGYTGIDRNSFIVEMFKEEIYSFVEDIGTTGIAVYEYDRSTAEKIISDIISGGKNFFPMLKDDLGDVLSDVQLGYLQDLADIFEGLGDFYDIVKRSEQITEILMNCICDYSQGLAVLDALENSSPYLGENNTFYKQALMEVRMEFTDAAVNWFSKIGHYVMTELVKEGIKEFTKAMLGDYAKSYALGNLVYKVAGDLGAYSSAEDYVTFMTRVRTYENAEKAYEDAFQTVLNGNTSDTAKQNLAIRFETARVAGWRAMNYLSTLDHGYMKKLNLNALYSLVNDLEDDSCPFLQ